MSKASLSDADIDELQRLLDLVAQPLEPLDTSMLDGFLCGVLLQPRRPEPATWLPYVTDVDARALPSGFATSRLHELAQSRLAELDLAIARRQWFDPWVFELTPQDQDGHPDGEASSELDAAYPWVAGFAFAMSLFPDLLSSTGPALVEALALLYRHLDPDDLEDAGDLLDAIAELPEQADLAEAVEDLVRATLLLADVSRPRAATAPQRRPGPHAQSRGGRPRSR